MSKRLNQKEKDILGAIELAADKPLSSFSKALGLKDTTIRYNVQNLIDSKIIRGSSPFLDLTRLGYTHYTVLFSISSPNAKARDAFEQSIGKAEGIAWGGIFGGDYQYGITLIVGGVENVADSLMKLATNSGVKIVEKSISAKLRFVKFGRQHLSAQSDAPAMLTYDATRGNLSIDDIDHKILLGLDQSENQSLRHLERSLGIPFSTIRRRIQRLEESELIVGYSYQYDLAPLGMLTYSLLIFTRGIDPEVSKQLLDFSVQHPQVIFFVENLGPWDYELGFETTSPKDVAVFTNKLYDLFGSRVHAIRPIQIFQTLRESSYPFIEAPST